MLHACMQVLMLACVAPDLELLFLGYGHCLLGFHISSVGGDDLQQGVALLGGGLHHHFGLCQLLLHAVHFASSLQGAPTV